METNQTKLEGSFIIIADAILDKTLTHTAYSYYNKGFEIDTNVCVESDVDIRNEDERPIGCVTDYWGGCSIRILETQELYNMLDVSNSNELLDLLYKADNNDNIDREDINPGGDCPFVFELPNFKGKIKSFEYDEDELDDMCDVSIKIGEIIGIDTKTNEKVHLNLTVF